ncbi:TPA: hypothetical protein R8G72_004501 [Citrobacter youngae]|nr:hypothetical protein [Citrobacter youngae]HEF0074341.1 hypothetical protein [Citrobacter youngae]
MIYHYTDLNAAKSIAENAVVWLTECRYLNDKEEFTTGLKILHTALTQTSYDGYPADFISTLQQEINYLIQTDFKAPLASENLFVASFSTTPDSLSQWRSYGMFMLAFEEDFLSRSQIANEYYQLQCHYAVNEKDALNHAVDMIRSIIIPALYSRCKRENMLLLNLWLTELMEIYALSFKHKAFESECETRLVIACRNNAPEIKFRVKGDLLIPYIELEINPLSLRSINVGPVANQELSVASLTMFANSRAKQVQIDENESSYSLYVNPSETPYRSL